MGRRRRPAGRAAGTGTGARALPEAIAALCRTLPAGPGPETFRRAKFDLPEAAPALWRLLSCVLSPRSEADTTGSLTREAQVRLVKSAMRSQGYPRPALFQLPEDGSQGSRELLLALSWLLARGPLIEQLLARTRVRLGDEMPVCECEDLAYGRASPGLPTPSKDADGCVDVRHVQWLMGKLRFRWRSLISSHQEHCALLSKIHKYTQGCHSDRNLGHLSVAETELLRDPEGGQQLLQMLEFENVRLEAALEWRRLEQVFWQWMDTVLGASPPDSPNAGSQPTFLPSIPERVAGELELVSRELQALQKELQEAVEVRRASWEAQVRGQGPEWSAEMRASKEAVGQELAALWQAWEREGGLAQPHRPNRLVRSEAGAPPGQGLWATEAIGALRSKEACLEAVLCWLQGQSQQELARLAGALPGVIWIPPHGR
ncbi:tubulin epsilon and delta complex protein 1 isoform X1 [Loxodonta africana]|uniref:tubulin epsilon and delta complex protein 1 isoform X1 n=1 Tax=Loxodonta africana TaxID=9785 RepID=UPI0030CDA502